MPTKPTCDCLNRCGDDPYVHAGRAQPCSMRVRWLARPRVQGVGRMADNDRAVLVSFDRNLSDDELRAVHEYLRGFNGA